MIKKLLRRDILLVFVPIVVILLTAVVVVALQSRSSVKAPSPLKDAVVTINGEAMCLPHKDTSGPQTMECAFGLKDEKGQYYALGDTDPNYKNLSALPMGEKIEVKGTFEKGESAIYPTIGTIKVTDVTRR